MLRAVDLEMIYPGNGLKAVTAATFGVQKGTVLGLLGPNGAGKSSTFSMLAMDLARSSGEGEIMGENISKISLRTKGNQLGMCP
jgi:ABC-type multidrug transport system ATPase subunit